MAMTSQPDITYVTKYISDGNKSVVSLKNLYETLLVTDEQGNGLYRVPWNDFFIRYKDQLMSSIQFHSVPQSMFYKPKMVSLDLYGTTELWLSLLRLNGLKNITEFNYPIIKVYNPGNLFELINVFFKREGIVS